MQAALEHRLYVDVPAIIILLDLLMSIITGVQCKISE